MKKMISALLFAAAALTATSCSEAEDLIDDLLDLGDEVEYVGETNVSSSGIVIYTQESSKFILEKDDDALSIEMDDIQFNANMPAMDIKISDIPTSNGSFSIDSVIPTLEGVPMESYIITEVSGSYDNESLTIDFVCLTLNINFTGSVE